MIRNTGNRLDYKDVIVRRTYVSGCGYGVRIKDADNDFVIAPVNLDRRMFWNDAVEALKNHKTGCRLPTISEWKLIMDNLEEVNDSIATMAMSDCIYRDEPYWTADVQLSGIGRLKDSAVRLIYDKFDYYHVNSYLNVRPIYIEHFKN